MKQINVKALGEYCGLNPHKAKKFINDPESVVLTAEQKRLVSEYLKDLIDKLDKIKEWANLQYKATQEYKEKLQKRYDKGNRDNTTRRTR